MSSESLRPADRRILQYLQENPPEYVPLVANRLGMHLGYAEQRFETLVEEEYVEAVTNEAIYRITEAGECYLETEVAAAAADD